MISQKLSDLLYVRTYPWQNTGFRISTKKAPCCWATWVCEYHQSSTKKVDDSCDRTNLCSQHGHWKFPCLASPCLPKGHSRKTMWKSWKLKIMLPQKPLQEFEWNTVVCWVSPGLQKHEVLLIEEILHQFRLVWFIPTIYTGFRTSFRWSACLPININSIIRPVAIFMTFAQWVKAPHVSSQQWSRLAISTLLGDDWATQLEKIWVEFGILPTLFPGFRLEKCLKPPSLYSVSR